MLRGQFKDVGKRARRLPAPPMFLVALVLSFTLVIGIATALGVGHAAEHEEDVEAPGMYPATSRSVVASGVLPGVGEYRLLESRDHSGGLCIGLALKGGAHDGSDLLSEGCGGPEDLNIGTLTAGDGSWTVVHGTAPESSRKVTMRRPDGSTLVLPVTNDGEEIEGKFVVQKINGAVDGASFEARDEEGRTLATMELLR